MSDLTSALPHCFPVRVYYEDTDFSGVVYHASYLRFLERGRTELLRAKGIHHTALHAGESGDALAFAVRRMTLDFIRAARMDDQLVVETLVPHVGGASIEMTQRICRDGVVLLTAEVRVALVADGRARRLPASLAAKLA